MHRKHLNELISVLGICTLCHPWEALVIGAFASIVCALSSLALWKLRIDDPVGVIPVHLFCSIWGLLAIGMVMKNTPCSTCHSVDNIENTPTHIVYIIEQVLHL